MKYAKIFALTLLAASPAAFAERMYGEAGCGLGSMLMGKDGNQIFAATTNGTSANQTFAISTGTLNCVDDGVVAKNKALDLYLEGNKEALAKDMSRGQGETLVALSQVLGCQNSALFEGRMQGHYSQIFTKSQPSTTELSQAIRGAIRTDASLAEACRVN